MTEHPLKSFRKSRDLTLSDLAKLASISEASLSRIETGKQRPSFEAIERLKAATGIAADAFFTQAGGGQQ